MERTAMSTRDLRRREELRFYANTPRVDWAEKTHAFHRSRMPAERAGLGGALAALRTELEQRGRTREDYSPQCPTGSRNPQGPTHRSQRVGSAGSSVVFRRASAANPCVHE